MNKKNLVIAVIVFAVLAAAGVSLMVVSQTPSLAAASSVVLMAGTGMFTAALTFFLVEMFRMYAK